MLPPDSSVPIRIFINYRRDDTAGHAGRLYDALAARFGDDHVFMDIDAIDPGVDFTEVLDRAVDSSDIFISLIGRSWLTITDAQGRRRLDNPGDFVRLEIEAALGRDIRVIPVLVQEAEMPAADELPASLAPLAYRNATEIRDTSWGVDVAQLVRALEKLQRERSEEPVGAGGEGTTGLGIPRRMLLAALGAAGVLALGVLLAVLLIRDGDEETAPTGTSETRGAATDEREGGRIVYGDGTRLWAVDADGSNRVRGPGGGAPDWSSASGRVVYVRSGSISVSKADGSETRRLTSGRPRDNAPAWSRDGEWIAFDRDAGGGTTDVWAIRADGRGERNLTRDAEETGGAPDWSQDGTRIVYQRKRRLWMMNGDGSEQREIEVDLPGALYDPAWSPDGNLIAFVHYHPGGEGRSDVYVMRPDGSEPRRLTGGERVFNARQPAWSPGGTQLVFTAGGAVWVIPAEGGKRRLVRSELGVESPSWAAPG